VTRPVARPVALRGNARDAGTQAGLRETGAVNHAPFGSVLRISATRLEIIGSRLSAMDWELVRQVAELRLCSGAQLQRLFWPDGEAANQGRRARRTLKRLSDWHLVRRLPRSIGGVRAGSQGFLYGLGPAGARLLARETGFQARRLGIPTDRYIAHTLAIAEVVVAVHEARQRGQLEVIEVQTEPACWRGFIGAGGARVMLRPDLYLRVAALGSIYEYRWFCEVDLATEGASTLAAKARRYLAHYRSGSEQRDNAVYPKVLWAVPDNHRAAQVEAVLGRLPVEAQGLFAVCLLAEATSCLTAEDGW
jgi:hypothetical protein